MRSSCYNEVDPDKIGVKVDINDSLSVYEDKRVNAARKKGVHARLERLCNKSKKQMNEAGLLIDSLLITITKNLPLMLDTLNKFNEILKTDQITDQSEKVKKIDEFNKLGEEIIEMLNTFGKR